MNRCQLFFCLPMAAIGLWIASPRAAAAELVIDGGWVELISPELLTAPTADTPYTYDGGPWTISSTIPFVLTVSDWLYAGDLFQVYNYGNLFGQGSAIPISGDYASTPDSALWNPNFSQGYWILEPGDYSFTFTSTQFAPGFLDGTLAFKVESLPVPEGGATLLLLAVTLTGVAGFRALLRPGIGSGSEA